MCLRGQPLPAGRVPRWPFQNRTTSRQTQVDIEVGIDIAALTCKKVVDRTILIAGNTDLIQVAKRVHYEGIDFMPDPMWLGIASHRIGMNVPAVCSRCARDRSESIYRVCTLFLAYCESLDGQRAKG